jgi:hypothetical protein
VAKQEMRRSGEHRGASAAYMVPPANG